MKNRLLLIIVIVLHFSCVSIKKTGKNVSFNILDKEFLKDSSYVRLKISNKSKNNYFFPIDVSENSEKCSYNFCSYKKRLFLYLTKYVTNIKNDTMTWEQEMWSCHHIEENIDSLRNSCEYGIKKIIFVNSNSSSIIKVPVSLQLEFDDSVLRIKNYNSIDKNNYFLSLYYSEKDFESAQKYIDKKILDSIYKQGYKLYKSDISSNKIPIK